MRWEYEEKYGYQRERYERRAILIVHENLERFAPLVRELEARGSRVFAEGTLADARWLFQQYSPLDAILISYRLPDGDGLDFCRKHWYQTSAPLLLLAPDYVLRSESHADALFAGCTMMLDETLSDELLMLQMEVFWRRARWIEEGFITEKSSNDEGMRPQ